MYVCMYVYIYIYIYIYSMHPGVGMIQLFVETNQEYMHPKMHSSTAHTYTHHKCDAALLQYKPRIYAYKQACTNITYIHLNYTSGRPSSSSNRMEAFAPPLVDEALSFYTCLCVYHYVNVVCICSIPTFDNETWPAFVCIHVHVHACTYEFTQ
jgi:hypothetical protein